MRAGQVIVYVEGPSDKMAMESLLEPILDRAKQKGTFIRFFPLNTDFRKGLTVIKI